MTVGVGEVTRVAAVESLGGSAGDRTTAVAGGRHHPVDLVAAADVLRECDAGEPACAVGRHPRVGGELVPAPEHHGHAAGLQEDGLLALLAAPAEALVEGLRPGDVVDAERDQADALVHAPDATRLAAVPLCLLSGGAAGGNSRTSGSRSAAC